MAFQATKAHLRKTQEISRILYYDQVCPLQLVQKWRKLIMKEINLEIIMEEITYRRVELLPSDFHRRRGILLSKFEHPYQSSFANQ